LTHNSHVYSSVVDEGTFTGAEKSPKERRYEAST
jgi:hypothetical protein